MAKEIDKKLLREVNIALASILEEYYKAGGEVYSVDDDNGESYIMLPAEKGSKGEYSLKAIS